MTVLILSLCGIIAILVAVFVLLMQGYQISSGKIEIDETYNGPKEMQKMCIVLLRIFFKQGVALRKLAFQYVLHFWVRCLFYIDKLTTLLYLKSRNFFVKNAVKNKSSVSHFWEHLKVYKQEIDKEKEE